jgi:beta-glucosidase
VKALVATGKPVIVYLAHSRPRSINYIVEHATAIIDGWFTEEEAGNAFANILFGDVCPSGKLTISILRSVGQLPIYYNHKPSEHFFDYVQEKNTPLYAFGYGLSYTNFHYSRLRLQGNIVTVDVTNTGKIASDEIVQLYSRQKLSSVTRPIKELKNFSRISLRPGETRSVSFTIDKEKFEYWNCAMKYVADNGIFEIMIGSNSNAVQKVNYEYK